MVDKKIKISLIQQKFHKTKEETILYTEKQIQKSSGNGAKLVILQELHQTEYFCQSHNIDFFDYADSWEKDIEFWGNIAKKYKVVLVSSLFEKKQVGIYYNTAVVFDVDGSISGKYRKTHIPEDPNFHEKFYFKSGDLDLYPIQTSIGKLGVLICWDQWFPEASRIMALNGADILIYPTAIGWIDEDKKKDRKKQLDNWITIQRSHSIANGIPLVSCNRVGFETNPNSLNKGIYFWGNSFICDSEACIISQASETEEQILFAEINFNKNIRKIWPFFRDRRIKFEIERERENK